MECTPIDLYKEHFEYCEGVLYIKVPTANNQKIGSRAGYFDKASGYIRIRFMGKQYAAHRVIWGIFNGEIPKGIEIDHINGIRDDNHIENLRAVTRSQNNMNRPACKTNKSGYKGVSWRKNRNRWIVHIRADGKRYEIGTFKTIEEANNAYLLASKKFHGEYGVENRKAGQ